MSDAAAPAPDLPMPAPPADAAPATTESPNNNKAPVPHSSKLVSLLAAAPSNTDAFMAHLQRCLSTPSGIDTCLLFVCYTSRFSAAALETFLTGPLVQRGAKRFVELAAKLAPTDVVLFAAGKGGLGLPAGTQVLLQLAKRLKALSVLMSEARTITRLWGLVGMYFWARGLYVKLTEKKEEKALGGGGEKLETSIAWCQLIACTVYQVLENLAYLSSRGVLGWSPQAQGKMGMWATRGWGTHVGLEIIRLMLESSKREKARKLRVAAAAVDAAAANVDESAVATTTTTEEKELEAKEESEWADTWRKQLVRNMSWFPLTIHWGLEQGLVNELTVGTLGSIPGFVQMGDLWRRTASE